jgi:hypothetical protein
MAGPSLSIFLIGCRDFVRGVAFFVIAIRKTAQMFCGIVA